MTENKSDAVPCECIGSTHEASCPNVDDDVAGMDCPLCNGSVVGVRSPDKGVYLPLAGPQHKPGCRFYAPMAAAFSAPEAHLRTSAPTMLGRAHEHFEVAHDTMHELTGLLSKKYPEAKDVQRLLDIAHDAVHSGHEELHDHLDAVASTKSSATLQSATYAALAIGHVMGHINATVREPKANGGGLAGFFSSLTPETKASGLALLAQLGQALKAIVDLEIAKRAPSSAGVGAAPDAPAQEPVVTPPPGASS